MKKLLLICIAAVAVLASCNDYETYGDKKEKERNAISKFISDYGILVIDEDQFVLQGCTTDTARNEYVKLNKSGVYMQIARPGCGEKLKDGETANICCRFRTSKPTPQRSATTLMSTQQLSTSCASRIPAARSLAPSPRAL